MNSYLKNRQHKVSKVTDINDFQSFFQHLKTKGSLSCLMMCIYEIAKDCQNVNLSEYLKLTTAIIVDDVLG